MENDNILLIDVNDIDNNSVNVFIKDIDGNDFSFLDKKNYANIKYLKVKEMKNYVDSDNVNKKFDGRYHQIKFICNDQIIKDKIVKLFTDICNENEKYNCTNAENILKQMIKYFEYESKTTLKNSDEFLGDFGEFLFIYKCLELNCNYEIQQAIFKKDNSDTFDFCFSNNLIEIKSTTNRTSEIKLSWRQVPNSTNKFLCICKFDLERSKQNSDYYFNIVELLEKINNLLGPTNFIKTKINSYMGAGDAEELYVNWNTVKFGFFNNNYLPQINVTNDNILKDVILCLDVTNSLEALNFNNKLISIIKN